MKSHNDLLDLPDEEVEEELKARHENKLLQEARDVKQNIGVSVPEELQNQLVKEEITLHHRLMNSNKVYLERVQLSK